MFDFSAAVGELSGLLDILKPDAIDKLGPFGNNLKLVGAALLAATALFSWISWKTDWSPPTPAAPKLPPIGATIIVAVGLFVIQSRSGSPIEQVDLWRWCFVILAVGIFGVLVYFVLKSQLCFSCEYDPDTLYVRGFWLMPQARFVLRGEASKLSGQYVLHKRADGELDVPHSASEFFCRTDKAENFVWREWSVSASRIFLIIWFWLAMVPLPLALYAASAASAQPDLTFDRKTITLPADVLFAFDSDAIRTTAAASLSAAAEIIRKNKISHARINGHTDGRGDPGYNRGLSLRRANAVRKWLIEKETLDKVAFETKGFAADNPVASETRDGKDAPHGRQLNRRVEIELLR